MKNLLLLSLLLPGVALAQAPPPPPAAAQTAVTPADTAYHEAFRLLASGDKAGARAQLELILNNYPSDPLAARAQVVYGLITPGAGPQDKIVSGEQPTGLARGELVAVQTLHGIAIGVETALILEVDDVRAVVALLLAGGGAGLTASLLYQADEGITPGHTAALNSGTYWGAWHGGAMLGIFDYNSTPAAAGTMVVAQLGGLGIGEVLYRTLEPTAGDVSMATSAGVWAGALMFFAHGANEFDASAKTTLTTMLIASDVGLVAGAFASKYYPMSRSRSLVVDAGGIVGTLVGAGIPLLVQGDDPSATAVFGGAGVGAVTGLATSYYLTRNWDAPEDLALDLMVLPVEGGATVGLSGQW